jgi:hypothetical protein
MSHLQPELILEVRLGRLISRLDTELRNPGLDTSQFLGLVQVQIRAIETKWCLTDCHIDFGRS